MQNFSYQVRLPLKSCLLQCCWSLLVPPSHQVGLVCWSSRLTDASSSATAELHQLHYWLDSLVPAGGERERRWRKEERRWGEGGEGRISPMSAIDWTQVTHMQHIRFCMFLYKTCHRRWGEGRMAERKQMGKMTERGHTSILHITRRYKRVWAKINFL